MLFSGVGAFVSMCILSLTLTLQLWGTAPLRLSLCTKVLCVTYMCSWKSSGGGEDSIILSIVWKMT